MSSLSWLGKTLCPPDCLVKSDIKAPSCAAIFQFRIVALQCVPCGEVFCGLHVAHVRIICPVRDIIHMRKCTRPSPALPYSKRRKAGRGPGNKAIQTLFFDKAAERARKIWCLGTRLLAASPFSIYRGSGSETTLGVPSPFS